jgi:hypothetical protein
MRRSASFVLVLGVAIVTMCSAAVAFAGVVDLQITGAGQRAYYVGLGGTAHYLDGWVYNRADFGNNCTDIVVTAVAKNSSDVALATLMSPLPIHVLNAHTSQFFHLQVYPPAGTDHWDMSVTGASTAAAYLGSFPVWSRTTDATGRRTYSANFLTGSGSISSLIAAGKEDANTIDDPDFSDGATFLNSMTDLSHAKAAYGPGRTLPMRLVGLRTTALPFVFQQGWATWVEYTPQVVQRFYNKRNGSHFYTADPDEAGRVATTLSHIYSYDGPAYRLNTSNPSNMRPLYRFYNRRNGSHFYTVDPAERDLVIATLASTYSYDGPAYSVSTFQWFSKPVYRFYNRISGTHFYTADLSEANRVMTTLAATYTYEGIGYFLAY